MVHWKNLDRWFIKNLKRYQLRLYSTVLGTSGSLAYFQQRPAGLLLGALYNFGRGQYTSLSKIKI